MAHRPRGRRSRLGWSGAAGGAPTEHRGVRAHRRRGWGIAAAVLALFATGFGPPQFMAGDSSGIGLTPSQLRGLQAYQTPVVSARAAALLDTGSGAVVYSKNGQERFAPASLTKMMTA